VEFNLHWVTKPIDGKPQYQMTSIFAHRTSKLLKLEDFKEARKQARNFREYFQEIRHNFLHELQLYSHPPVPVVLEEDQPKGSQDIENPEQGTLGDKKKLGRSGISKGKGGQSGNKRKGTEDNRKQAAKRTKLGLS
jgi:hypothetical protein